MRFMMMVHGDARYEAGTPPDPALMAAIGQMSEKARKSGKLVMDGGLMPSKAGVRTYLRNGKVRMVDGPFTETKELIGGFAIFDLSSMEEAKAMAQEFVAAHMNAGVKDMTMDIRRVYGPEDMGGCPGS
jgi:hypothetical protein